jgi:hypothetical protein
MTHTTSRAGFGFMHDGSVDTLSRFMGEPVFIFDQGLDLPPQLLVPAMVAFMLTFSGSDLPMGEGVPTGPIGPLSKDTHAAVGTQITLNDLNNNEPETLALIDDMIALADAEQDSTPGPEVAVVAKGVQDGIQRGYAYIGNDLLQSDRVRETLTVDALRQASATGAEVTFTVVSRGSELRIGVDRDEDGHFDRDELDACSDPANPSSVPDPTDLNGNAIPDACECLGDVDDDGEVNVLDLLQLLSQWGECEGCSGDSDGDGQIGVIDLLALLAQWGPC